MSARRAPWCLLGWLVMAAVTPAQAQPLLPPQQQPPQPQAPFVLNPEQQAGVNRLLGDWERQSGQIQTMRCQFTKWDFNPPVLPNRAEYVSEGEILYAAPDRGVYQVTKVNKWIPVQPPAGQPIDPNNGALQPAGTPGDHWVCDGKSIFEVRHTQRQLVERPLPPQLQGQAISDGPLPFFFGVQADKLNARYWIRVTHHDDKEVRLEAYPKRQADAANFIKADLILRSGDLMPIAIQLYRTNGATREVYEFTGHDVNNRLHQVQNFFGRFARPNTPLGYQHVVENLTPPPAQGPQQAAQAGQLR